ncbi:MULTISPECIES: CaiB/BaiF CoA transferase family protein [Halolamina]|uniref:Crotonobetainyl-CoA:carnitine CoA-transferase CaiB n=1 Tax=Halolamina pelagica TaxID=699431 RepID=A0A1I5TGB3_9EURY|nr:MULTISPECIES: CoA transferase [Halolamina]NHX37336.1 CoA transferase [Halolamina sp. R1-12]SFP82079.1 Crotonobetainyl-CoA:carnitine CoA-transferase CaiB [Halolamina pelagica]
MSSEHASGPLDGLRVIDCSGMISGGFATVQLADFGADVVMVEHPEHPDPIREWPPFDEGESLWWKSLARNKRCVTLDLSTEEGSALLLDLVEDADVLFENFRPGTMEEWGVGPETLRAENPELVVVRLSGYGQTGPRARKPGFGTVAEGLSGWAAVNGFPDSKPLLPPISLADLTAAQFAVQATMFAIFERDVGRGGSGEGQVIDVSLYESLFRLFVGDVAGYDRLGKVPERTGNHHASAAPRNVYETEDGYMTLSASSQSIFENLMDAIDRPDLVDDPRFADNDARVEHNDALDEVIEAWTRKRSTEQAIEEMEAADAVVGPVHDVSDIFEDEQYAARGDIIAVEDEDLGTVRMAATLPKFSRTPGSVRHTGPKRGEHNDEVFREELSLDGETYDRLRERDVI